MPAISLTSRSRSRVDEGRRPALRRVARALRARLRARPGPSGSRGARGLLPVRGDASAAAHPDGELRPAARAGLPGSERGGATSSLYLAFGRHRGKFLHVSADGARDRRRDPERLCRRVARAANGDPQDPRRRRPRPEREWESFVVSEDDHIDYLAQADISVVVPVTLAAELRRSHFLFLGYQLHEWSLRVFLHRVWGRERVGLPLLGDRRRRGRDRAASSGASAGSTRSTCRSTSTWSASKTGSRRRRAHERTRRSPRTRD